MIKFALILAVFVVACDQDMPSNIAGIGEEVKVAAREEWMDKMGVEPKCAEPVWSTVSVEEFRHFCKQPSCVETGAAPCAHACTRWINNIAFGVYAGEVPVGSGVWFMSEQTSKIHETFHVWSKCTLGTADAGHVNPKVWTGLMGENPDMRDTEEPTAEELAE